MCLSLTELRSRRVPGCPNPPEPFRQPGWEYAAFDGGSSAGLPSAKLNVGIVQRYNSEFSCQSYLPIVDCYCSFTVLNPFLYQKTLNPVITCAVPNFLSIVLGKNSFSIDKTGVPHAGGKSAIPTCRNHGGALLPGSLGHSQEFLSRRCAVPAPGATPCVPR